jgi:hypothetical protein
MATRESSFLVNLQVQTSHALVCGYQSEAVPAVKPGAVLDGPVLRITRDTETPPGSGIDIQLVYNKER